MNLKERMNKKSKEISKTIKFEYKFNEETLLIFKDFSKEIDNSEISKSLENSSLELLNLNIKNTIETGRILTEGFNLLNQQGSKQGLYEKWLDIININKNTALRLRRRFDLFSLTNKKGQKLIATLPQKYIDSIYKFEDREGIIKIINKGEEFKSIIEPSTPVNIDSVDPTPIDSAPENLGQNLFKSMISLEQRINKVSSEDKFNKIKNLLEKIEEILN